MSCFFVLIPTIKAQCVKVEYHVFSCQSLLRIKYILLYLMICIYVRITQLIKHSYILCVVSAGTLSEAPMHNLVIINTSVHMYIRIYVPMHRTIATYMKHIAGKVLRIILCKFCCFYGFYSHSFLVRSTVVSRKKLTFYNRNYAVLWWEKRKNSILRFVLT